MLLFRAEDFDLVSIHFNKWAVDQINAVWNSREYRFETLADGFRFSGEIHNQGSSTDASSLARKDRRGHVLERCRTHELSESGEHFLADGLGSFWSNVTHVRAGFLLLSE